MKSVALRLEDEALSGLPRPVILKGSSGLSWKEKWASEGREAPETFSSGETWIDPELFRGGGICRSARPRILIFPRYQTDQPFQVQPLSQAQAAFMLLQRLVNARNLPGHGFPFITSLSKKIRAYQVVYNEITPGDDGLGKRDSGFRTPDPEPGTKFLSAPPLPIPPSPAKGEGVTALSLIQKTGPEIRAWCGDLRSRFWPDKSPGKNFLCSGP